MRALTQTKVPPILLQGDQPGTTPGKTAPTPRPTVPPGPDARELPEAYGTGRLTLTARDPRCVYAHWDLTTAQQRYYNSLSADGHLALRIHFEQAEGPLATELQLQADSRHWFVNVPRAGCRYTAELGYYQADRQWRAMATSEPVTIPSESLAPETSLRFATIPWESPLPELRRPEPQTFQPAPERPLRSALIAPPPFVTRKSDFTTTPATNEEPGVPLAPVEFVKRLVSQHEQGPPLEIAAQYEIAPLAFKPLNISSPIEGGRSEERQFCLALNAELIIYGATMPEAQVRVGGQPIQLRPDGTFSCRFALPDGKYELSVTAVSPQAEVRQAEFSFIRETRCQSEIGVHPHDPALHPPPGRAV